MSEKPSYLGLLNAIAVAEKDACAYLTTWAQVTPSPDVRGVLHTIAVREEEHGMAFEKRIDELGFGLLPRADPKHAERMAIAGSTVLSDREKFEALNLCQAPANGTRDIFDGFFENKDIDPVTGGLLGRYVAEERDSGRKFAACYTILCAAEKKSAKRKAKAPSKAKKK